MARPLKNSCEYFPHDAGMRNHKKVKALRVKFPNGYAIWAMLLEYLTANDGNEFENSDLEYELMAGDFGFTVEEVKAVVEYCIKIEMLFNANGFIYSESLNERLAPVYIKRGKAKELSAKQRRTNGRFCNSNTDTSDVSVTETPQSKVNKTKLNKSKEFKPPTVDEVVSYFSEKGYKEEIARKAHEYYDTAGWEDSEGKPVKNWQQKMIAVWFKDEHKTPVFGTRNIDRSRHPNWPDGYPYNDTNIYYFDNGRIDKMSIEPQKKTA